MSMIIASGTIISSFFSSKVIAFFGTGITTLLSVTLTSVALMGFSFSSDFWMLCLWAIPYGIGAGSVDVALNNFVALHYKSRHMSWLHCFWGIGATLGPYIMGLCLAHNFLWNTGYQIIGFMQIALAVVLLCTLPLWKIKKNEHEAQITEHKTIPLKEILALSGAKSILIAFFSYCTLEICAGFWASTYMVLNRGIDVQKAATWTSLFYFGITGGRFLSGFISDALGNRRMIRLGLGFVCVGLVLLFLPNDYFLLAGLIILGLGCAPIYPSLLHATPENFGSDKSSVLMGIQMACAYTGATFMPPLFGFLGEKIGLGLYPVFLTFFALSLPIK
ncbi:MAG: MFS transporter [Spirochaetia bacterium]